MRLQGEGEEVICAGWLHDTLEDAAEKVQHLLRSGMPKPIFDAVHLLTKKAGVPYEIYLAEVKSNEIARKVKIADMLHNLSDQPTKQQIIKYAKGLLYLVEPSK